MERRASRATEKPVILEGSGTAGVIRGDRGINWILYTEAASVYQGPLEMWRQMEQPSEKASRKPRTDALLNRERLLLAAREVFGKGGTEATLEAVAKTAGVGIGTLYRHFPTREALFQAVYRNEIDQLVELAGRLSAEKSPVEALRDWLRASVGMVATKKGMLAALTPSVENPNELYGNATTRLIQSTDALLQSAIVANRIRSDIPAEDILRAVFGMCYTREQDGWQEAVMRLVDVFVDGLRTDRLP